MKNNFNKVLISIIQDNLPSNVKLVNYLMEILCLGKESAYRRIRNQIPFTMDDVIKLSYELNFSLDEVIGASKEKRVFVNVKENDFHDGKQTFAQLLKTYLDFVKKLIKAENKEVIASLNHIPLISFIPYDHLFRFFYYKWLHQLHGVSSSLSLSEIVVPSEIIELKNKVYLAIKQAPQISHTYIWDQDVFLNRIKIIRYYYKRNLISDEELNLIKKDFHGVIDWMERLVQSGTDETQSRYYFYLSILGVESNCILANRDNEPEAYVGSYSILPMQMTNSEVCNMLQKALCSQKKYSTLITQCNEFLQVKFFEKQRQYLNDIMNYSFFSFYEQQEAKAGIIRTENY